MSLIVYEYDENDDPESREYYYKRYFNYYYSESQEGYDCCNLFHEIFKSLYAKTHSKAGGVALNVVDSVRILYVNRINEELIKHIKYVNSNTTLNESISESYKCTLTTAIEKKRNEKRKHKAFIILLRKALKKYVRKHEHIMLNTALPEHVNKKWKEKLKSVLMKYNRNIFKSPSRTRSKSKSKPISANNNPIRPIIENESNESVPTIFKVKAINEDKTQNNRKGNFAKDKRVRVEKETISATSEEESEVGLRSALKSKQGESHKSKPMRQKDLKGTKGNKLILTTNTTVVYGNNLMKDEEIYNQKQTKMIDIMPTMEMSVSDDDDVVNTKQKTKAYINPEKESRKMPRRANREDVKTINFVSKIETSVPGSAKKRIIYENGKSIGLTSFSIDKRLPNSLRKKEHLSNDDISLTIDEVNDTYNKNEAKSMSNSKEVTVTESGRTISTKQSSKNNPSKSDDTRSVDFVPTVDIISSKKPKRKDTKRYCSVATREWHKSSCRNKDYKKTESSNKRYVIITLNDKGRILQTQISKHCKPLVKPNDNVVTNINSQEKFSSPRNKKCLQSPEEKRKFKYTFFNVLNKKRKTCVYKVCCDCEKDDALQDINSKLSSKSRIKFKRTIEKAREMSRKGSKNDDQKIYEIYSSSISEDSSSDEEESITEEDESSLSSIIEKSSLKMSNVGY